MLITVSSKSDSEMALFEAKWISCSSSSDPGRQTPLLNTPEHNSVTKTNSSDSEAIDISEKEPSSRNFVTSCGGMGRMAMGEQKCS